MVAVADREIQDLRIALERTVCQGKKTNRKMAFTVYDTAEVMAAPVTSMRGISVKPRTQVAARPQSAAKVFI